MMKRTEFTYGQLDKVLRSFGLSSRLINGEPPARAYEHPQYGLLFTVPTFPMTDHVLDYHLIAARTLLDQFGVADPKKFDAKLRKVAGPQRSDRKRIAGN
jgi:hypothetical protein